MAVIFPRWTNRIPLAIGVGAPVVLSAVVGAVWYWFSPYYTDVGYSPEQPVPFSHKLHAGDLGMDCRYCHNTVERSAYAAVPPTATCMNCHATILPQSPKLAPIRESFASGEPVEWVRVHMLPDYAFFNHSVHIAAGVGCAECHGRIDQMKVVEQAQPLSMGWCLQCHNDPEPRLRPLTEITNMGWTREAAGNVPTFEEAHGRKPSPPIHCSGCHR